MGINGVRLVKRGVILGNLGYQRGNMAVMLLKVDAVVFQIWLKHNIFVQKTLQV